MKTAESSGTSTRRKKKTNGAGLGIFVVVAAALFIAGIYFVGQKQLLFSTVFRVSCVFNNVSGLQVGNNVRFSGINVGSVENIEIVSDTSVKVDMIIDESTRKFIKKDAKAVIGSDGLMGNRIINITPGSEHKEMIKNNDVIAAVQPLDLDEIWSKLKATSDNAANITGGLSEIVESVRSGKGTIGRLFMDSTLADNLGQTLVNVKRGAKGFEDNMEAASHSFLLKGLFKKKNRKDKEADRKLEDRKTAREQGEKKSWKERREERKAERKKAREQKRKEKEGL